MSLTEKFIASKIADTGARYSISLKDPLGHDAPVLNIIDGTGPKVPDHVVQTLGMNIASLLNGNEPLASAHVTSSLSWNEVKVSAAEDPLSLSIRFTFRDGPAHNSGSTLYMRLHDASGSLDPRVKQLITGGKRDGLKTALDRMTPPAAFIPRQDAPGIGQPV